MSRFPHYHVHSCSFCHNYSYLLVLLTPPSNLTLNPTPNLMLDPMSDPSRKPRTLNPTTLNHCALTSTADLAHSQIYISMSDCLLAHASVSLPNSPLLK